MKILLALGFALAIAACAPQEPVTGNTVSGIGHEHPDCPNQDDTSTACK